MEALWQGTGVSQRSSEEYHMSTFSGFRLEFDTKLALRVARSLEGQS